MASTCHIFESIVERAADVRAPEIRPPLSGRVNAKVEPLAISLVTQIRPRWSSMNFRDSASPSPSALDLLVCRPHLPELFEVWARASWTEPYRSKNAGCSAGQRQVGFVP